MLHDRARIEVKAGAGGDGCASFRREAHVPRGGPDGGDGGRGGDVVLVCDESLRDLQGFRRKAHYRAGRGGHGEGAQRHGADGQTLLVRVPPGTQAEGVEGELAGRRWELLADGQQALLARGGSGGHGNKRFATPTRQAPRFAERGLSGEQGLVELQLKLLADVGLVGLPNAGKSSLLARLTRAAPKIADYPFTTLSPVLGVLESEERQLVIADIPGLIEGASEGAGLGHDFLAHVERTRLLVHVLDLAPQLTGDSDPAHPADPLANHETIERELAAHDARLAALPRALALSKADLVSAETVERELRHWRERLGEATPVIATSSATGLGVRELAGELLRTVPAREPAPVSFAEDARSAEQPLAEHMVFRPAGPGGFSVEQRAPGSYVVSGRGVERLLARHDLDNEDALHYVEGRLRRIGVLGALQARGYQSGDELTIAGVSFELDPDEHA
ncbi:MAG TPA: GTPase ObgE [Solirubrobacteraceae bacterium]|nr:GTPase ObgE [Solirubrobacteraceae bacterium]